MSEPHPVGAPDAAATLTPGVVVQPLDPARDEEAAAILAPCTAAGTVAAGREALAAARGDPKSAVYGLVGDDTLLAVYVTRQAPMSVEVTHVAVAERHRRRGHGRSCLQDALRRAGRRPLVVEADEETLGFYRACGFKPIGRRTGSDGTVRYRLGWHAPAADPRDRLRGLADRPRPEARR